MGRWNTGMDRTRASYLVIGLLGVELRRFRDRLYPVGGDKGTRTVDRKANASNHCQWSKACLCHR